MALPVAALVPLAAVLGALATVGCRAVARRLDVVSAPDPFVAQHTGAVACLGGLAVAAATAATLAIDQTLGGVGTGAVVGALLFLGAGLLDDIRRLTPPRKLALQIVSASVAAALGATLPFTGNPVIDAVGGVVCIVVVVNAVNLTDVCDGLMSGLAVVAFLAFGATEPSLWAPCLAVGGACLGFLVFNAPPASIFLGDAGSNFLGFVLAALALNAAGTGDAASRTVQAALFLGVPLFELAFVILARARKREPWWKGSSDHFSLRLQAAGLSRWQTDAIAWTTASALALAGLSYTRLTTVGRISLVLIVVGALAAVSRLLLRWEVDDARA